MIQSIAFALAAASQQTTPLFEIPRAFWGEYNERLADCGTGNNDSRLRISWDRLDFWESTGELRGLLRLPDGSVIVLAQYTGEGETWHDADQLRLSSDGSRLTVVHPQSSDVGQGEFVRLRCPAKAETTADQ